MIKVLIVDDSLFMRAAIQKTLETRGGFEIVGQARDGNEGVAKALALHPDVITMDYNMPGKNGAEAVRAIMSQQPIPVIMFSAHTKQGARETFDALAAGAVDFCTKPHGEVSADLSAIAEELVEKLSAAVSARPRAMAPVTARRDSSGDAGRVTLPPGGPKVVVVGVSTGGPAALSRVIPARAGGSRFGMIIVQHMPAQFTATLAERLDGLSAVTVREAKDGDLQRPGLVLVAPGGRHVSIDDRGAVQLTDDAPVNGCRPSVDVTMMAAARVFGRRTIGVILTGMGRDGADGMVAIKRAEGKTLVQDQESSVIFGMPRAAIERGAADEIVPLDKIASRLRYL